MSRINNPIQNSDSNAKDNAESKSATDAETCDKTIDTNGSDSLSGKIPNIEDKNIDEYGTETTQVEDSHTVEIKPPVLYVPAPKISPSKELNNNLAEYVIVTDNLSKPELVVLDSEDNDEGDKISIINNNLNIMTSDRTATAVLQVSHNRWMISNFLRLSVHIWWYQVSSEADDKPQVRGEAQRYQAPGQGEDGPQRTQNSSVLLVRLIPLTKPFIVMWYLQQTVIALNLYSPINAKN